MFRVPLQINPLAKDLYYPVNISQLGIPKMENLGKIKESLGEGERTFDLNDF